MYAMILYVHTHVRTVVHTCVHNKRRYGINTYSSVTYLAVVVKMYMLTKDSRNELNC